MTLLLGHVQLESIDESGKWELHIYVYAPGRKPGCGPPAADCKAETRPLLVSRITGSDVRGMAGVYVVVGIVGVGFEVLDLSLLKTAPSLVRKTVWCERYVNIN